MPKILLINSKSRKDVIAEEEFTVRFCLKEFNGKNVKPVFNFP